MDRKIEKKKWTAQKTAIVSIAGLLASFLIYNLILADSRTKLNVKEEVLIIAEVKKGIFQEFIPVEGVVHPIKTIFLDAIEGGVVREKFVEGGTLVKAGNPILKLSNNNLVLNFINRETEMYDLINNLENTHLHLIQNRFALQTQLTELKHEIEVSRLLYETNKSLYEQKAISKNEYLNSKISYDRLLDKKKIAIESQKVDSVNSAVQIKQLRETLIRTNRNLAMFKDNLNNLMIKAPISGQMSALNVEIGESISVGQRIGQIDDLDGFKVKAFIDEHYVARIFPGLQGEFNFDGRNYQLIITKVFNEITNGQFKVDMEFDEDAPQGIRRGQTLQMRLQLSDAKQAIIISRGGFFNTTGGNWIFVVNEEGNYAEKREVRFGRQNPQYFEVLNGLKPGDKVIISSYEGLGDAEKLILKE